MVQFHPINRSKSSSLGFRQQSKPHWSLSHVVMPSSSEHEYERWLGTGTTETAGEKKVTVATMEYSLTLRKRVFSHPNSTDGGNTIAKGHGWLPYPWVSSASLLTDLSDSTHKDAEHQLYLSSMCVFLISCGHSLTSMWFFLLQERDKAAWCGRILLAVCSILSNQRSLPSLIGSSVWATFFLNRHPERCIERFAMQFNTGKTKISMARPRVSRAEPAS